jgi:hypothetical protein
VGKRGAPTANLMSRHLGFFGKLIDIFQVLVWCVRWHLRTLQTYEGEIDRENN